MELRKFFDIFVIHKKIFFGIIFCSIAIGVIFYFIQPETYKTSLTLNVTRSGTQNVTEYTYDDFYRLQADERFADTIVQWILSPHIKITVFGHADGAGVSAKRLSSQVIDVTYKTASAKEGRDLATKMVSVLNAETQKLNQKQGQRSWFAVLGSAPVVQNNTYALHFLVALFAAIGFFVAFWTVMITHYVIGRAVKQ